MKKEKNTVKKRSPVFFVLPVVLLVFFFFGEVFGTTCYLASMAGIPCPACGSTRAALSLFRGDIGGALRMHPLIFLTLGLTLALPVYALVFFVMKKRGKPFHPPLSPRAVNVLLFVLIGAYLAVYLIRMFTLFPHTEPMRYNENSLLGRLIALARAFFAR